MAGHIVDISEVLLLLGLSGSVTEAEQAIAQDALMKAEGAVKRHLRYDPLYGQRTEYYPNMDMSRSAYQQEVWEANDTEAYIRRTSQASSDELQLRHLPIRGDVTLYIDYDGRSGARSGSFASDTQKTLGEDFWPNYDGIDSSGNKVCRDGILRSIGLWPAEPGSVKVVYYSGYTLAELHGQDTGDNQIDASPIVDAITDEAVRRVQKAYSRMKKAGAGFVGGPFTSENLGDYGYSIDAAILSRLVGGGMDLLSESVEKLQEFRNYGYEMAG